MMDETLKGLDDPMLSGEMDSAMPGAAGAAVEPATITELPQRQPSAAAALPWDEDTLDEPVLTTIHRDLRNVGLKLLYVLVPKRRAKLLHDWDLWGPLILTMTLAILLRSSASDAEERTAIFAGVFFIIAVGSAVVTLNAKLLGAKLSFFQSVCVIGYCLMPLVLSCVLLKWVRPLVNHVALRLLVASLGFGWAVYASVGFLSGNTDPTRKALIVYPLFLFYLVVAWLIVNDA